jgi:hypothetical protein
MKTTHTHTQSTPYFYTSLPNFLLIFNFAVKTSICFPLVQGEQIMTGRRLLETDSLKHLWGCAQIIVYLEHMC